MIYPQKHPIRTISLLILLTSIIFQCSDNSDTVPQQVIVGEWKISSVSCDGLVKPEWTGVAMRFTQITPDSGAYYVPETVNDSIWPAAGHWEKETGDFFLRDGSALVNYAEEKSKIMLFVYLPGTGQPACSDGTCLNLETGRWAFELEK
ncbi:MAG TPA: hypothetical protein VIU12_11215 [Chryseolinea sp.]